MKRIKKWNERTKEEKDRLIGKVAVGVLATIGGLLVISKIRRNGEALKKVEVGGETYTVQDTTSVIGDDEILTFKDLGTYGERLAEHIGVPINQIIDWSTFSYGCTPGCVKES